MADIKYIDLNGLGEAVKKIKEKADAAYAAADHGHEVADIIDLQVALDDKVDKEDGKVFYYAFDFETDELFELNLQN